MGRASSLGLGDVRQSQAAIAVDPRIPVLIGLESMSKQIGITLSAKRRGFNN